MKTLHFVCLLLLVTVTLHSCTKKDKEDKTFLYGDWTVISTHLKTTLNGAPDEDTLETLPAGQRTATFTNDLRYTQNDTKNPYRCYQGTYTLSSGILTLNLQTGTTITPLRHVYRLSGATLTLVQSDSEVNMFGKAMITYTTVLHKN